MLNSLKSRATDLDTHDFGFRRDEDTFSQDPNGVRPGAESHAPVFLSILFLELLLHSCNFLLHFILDTLSTYRDMVDCGSLFGSQPKFVGCLFQGKD